MPEIDALMGLSFVMYFFDNQTHSLPHVHVKYGEFELVIGIDSGEALEGYLPPKKRKLAESHIKANKTRLLAMWQMAVNGIHPGKL
ncbi:type II toxin-antitoxin system toxin DhiT [Edwardsiella tarda]|uniref:type II toxin-antitoxin system toxin DhiT n=2 Tax=Edwardsiella tarda TaxID=636 RepID=UPI0002DAD036|nr:DUF4160 domain-containing protein [Edwardsiella tarda]